MGVYDMLELAGMPHVDEGYLPQVKCWGSDMRTFKAGDEVPEVDGNRTYQLALLEGGYALVEDCRLVCWQETPQADIPIFDKWGYPYFEGVYDEWRK